MKRRAPAATASDAALILDLFDRLFPGPTWRAWRAWLCAVMGAPMTKAEAEIFRACTGRQTLPTQPAREAWTIVGRRGGKSRMAAFLSDFLAACRTYQLAPGEQGRVSIVSPSKSQGSIVFDYALKMLEGIPILKQQIVRQTKDVIELAHTSIVIQSASFRTPRGFTNVGAVCEEIAFWRDDTGANPDTEILRALRPSLASVPGSLLVAISSPYSTRGELYRTYEKLFGKDSDVLVWQADTRTMNPTIPQQLIDQALDEDPSAAAAEWLGVFRADLEPTFSRAALEAVIVRGRFELAPATGIAYVAFIDPSGGSADSFTLAIAHRDSTGRPVLDLIREVRPPFSPENVCAEFARELKRYGISSALSDSYAAEWPREQFRKHGIVCEPSPLTRSELFLELLPMVNSGGIELLDSARLLNQLTALERRTGRSGKDAVDHPRGSHDDVANAATGACVAAVRSVGLRAPLPSDFTECINFDATAAAHCVFLSRGEWFPADGHCRRHCPGLRAVRPVYEDHRRSAQTRGEPVMTPREFLWERFESNRLTSSFKQQYIEEALGL